MNSDQAWLFSVARDLNGHDVAALVIVWLWTVGFLVLGFASGRAVSLAIGVVSLLVALPWNVSRFRASH